MGPFGWPPSDLMESEFPFLSLLVMTGLVTFVPLLVSRLLRFWLPVVVGKIMAGMIVGCQASLQQTRNQLDASTTAKRA